MARYSVRLIQYYFVGDVEAATAQEAVDAATEMIAGGGYSDGMEIDYVRREDGEREDE